MTDREQQQREQQLRTAYARAVGLKQSVPSSGNVPALGNDLNAIVALVRPFIGDEMAEQLSLRPPDIWRSASRDGPMYHCYASVLHGKLGQLISYLEHVYFLNSHIVEIGSLYNSIKDAELKSRCSDLLSAAGNFDRVINQATLVLEDRIRTKSGIDKPLAGVQLVNAVLNADISKTILQISDNVEEHEGVCHICRGLMLSFRNPTHHHILDKYIREEALKLCAFIDNILLLVDNATVMERDGNKSG
jgi:Protein of unknown function (Hypoth_ymh)